MLAHAIVGYRIKSATELCMSSDVTCIRSHIVSQLLKVKQIDWFLQSINLILLLNIH